MPWKASSVMEERPHFGARWLAERVTATLIILCYRIDVIYLIINLRSLSTRLGHGFGPGIGTAAEGWIADATRFWEKFIESSSAQ